MRLIDADALRRRKELRFGLMAATTTIQFLIDEAPTVEERKQGRWKNGCCTVCGESAATDGHFDFIAEEEQKYCWNCGAIMDGEPE